MQQPPTYTLDGFLTRIHAEQQIAANASVKVEADPDPKVIGRTGYRLTGATRSAVAIRQGRILEDAEQANGYGEFVGPIAIEGGLYGSLGYTVVPVLDLVAGEGEV